MKPIIRSLLDTDFYKFTMGQLVYRKWRDVPVRYAFTSRTKDAKLGLLIKEEDLRRELDNVRGIRFNNSDLHYLRGTNEYQDRMFSEDYLQFLRGLKLPPYDLKWRGDTFELEFAGRWSEAIYWETFALSIINELYYRAILLAMSQFARDETVGIGRAKLADKIRKLKTNDSVIFSDFGTRRRFSRKWQDYVVRVLAKELPDQFRGTSNVYLAMKHGLAPMGTSAHELPMIMLGIVGKNSENPFRDAQNNILTAWWDAYNYGLSIALPDTYGTDFFFRTAPAQVAREWKGIRQDSGDPIEEGEKAIRWYESHRVNPRDKMIIFSDGLDVDTIHKLHDHFRGRINTTFGWGTNLTNDLGLRALSLVVKAVEANGRGLVKLSNNLAKAVGKPEDIELAKKECGYDSVFNAECRY